MSVDSILYQLLLRHECIIVPNFGGFIVRESPCNFNAAKDILRPGMKSVFFNPHLNENDGLLINAIMTAEQISYNEATAKLEKWVQAKNDDITSIGKSVITGIGQFNRGTDNNKWFSADPQLNLSLSTYGLKPVKVSVVNAAVTAEERTSTIVYKPLADNKPIESTDLPKIRWKAWAAAAAIAILTHIGYLTFEHSDHKVQEASVVKALSAENTQAPAVTTPEETPDEPTVVPENTTPTEETPAAEEPVVTVPQTSEPVQENKPEVKAETVVEEQPVATPAETPDVPQLKVVGKYKLEQNAVFHQKDLAKSGITAEVRLNDKGLYEVIVPN